MNRIKIQDGIHLNFIDSDKFKTNYINLSFLSELNDITASNDALLSRVLLRGTKIYPTQKLLNEALDEAYDLELNSDVSRIGEKHILEISECILDDAFSLDGESISGKAIDLIKEVIFSPYLPDGAFSKEYCESEKKFALDDIDAQINHKAKYAILKMLEVMCKGEKFSSNPIGKKSIIKKITPKSLFEYYKNLIKTAEIEIFCVGRFDKASTEKRIREMFYGVERCPAKIPETLYKKRVSKVKNAEDKLDIAQSNLAMGFRTNTKLTSDDWYALSLYNSILGGCLTSKLFSIIREKMSLCYNIFSQCDPAKGIMLIYAGISNDKKDITVKETLNQMKQIEEGNVSDEELESARGYLINSLTGLWDNPANLPDWFLVRITEGDFGTPDTVIENLKKVTLSDIIKVSKKIKLDTVYFLTGKGE